MCSLLFNLVEMRDLGTRVPSLTSAHSAQFLLRACVCPNSYLGSGKELGGSNAGAALWAAEPWLLVMPTLGRCAGAGAGAAVCSAAWDVAPVAGEHRFV